MNVSDLCNLALQCFISFDKREYYYLCMTSPQERGTLHRKKWNKSQCGWRKRVAVKQRAEENHGDSVEMIIDCSFE